MKKIECITAVLLLAGLVSCGSGKKSELLIVDVMKSYPEETFVLQDIAEVEYIPLETTDDFLVSDTSAEYVDDDYIIVANTNSGDIMFFDRHTGKGLWKVNRRGKGAGEYGQAFGLSIDRANGEMYVRDPNNNRVMVYDLRGAFRRQFDVANGNYMTIKDYDPSHLLGYESGWGGTEEMEPFVVLSKEDLSIVKHLEIPFEERITMTVPTKNGSVMLHTYPILEAENGFILSEFSSDTIYRLDVRDETLTPVIVRTPKAVGMDVPVNLSVTMETSRHIFMQTTKREYDRDNDIFFPTKYLAYDKKSGEIYSVKITDENFGGEQDYDIGVTTTAAKQYSAGVSVYGMSAVRLLDALEAGTLSGKLKDIASGLKEDDNPVLMIVEFK